MYRPLLLLAARFLVRLGCLPDRHGNEMPTVTTCYDPLNYLRKFNVKHYEFRLGFLLAMFKILCMIAGHCAGPDSIQFLLKFQDIVLQNRDHVAYKYVHNAL